MRFLASWMMLVLGLVASATSFAAPSTSVMSAEDRAALQDRWSGKIQTQYNQSLYKEDDASFSQTEDFAGDLGYKLTRHYSLSFHIDGTQDLRHQDLSDLGKASVAISHDAMKVADKTFLLTPVFSLRAPVSRADERASFITAATAVLKTAINPELMPSKKWDLAVSLVGTRYVHTYEEASDGSLNTEYNFIQVFSTAWSFTNWIAFAFEFDHINAWDYHGYQNEAYSHTEELDFTIDKHWSAAVGHQYGSSIWAANQQDYNFSLMDEQNSLVFGQLTYTF